MTSDDRDSDYNRQVQRQQVARVARELPLAVASMPVVVAVCLAVSWTRQPHALLLGWAAYTMTVAAVGAGLA